jgi:hypothetical protein
MREEWNSRELMRISGIFQIQSIWSLDMLPFDQRIDHSINRTYKHEEEE